jgi:aminoglycoside phosphotransferase
MNVSFQPQQKIIAARSSVPPAASACSEFGLSQPAPQMLINALQPHLVAGASLHNLRLVRSKPHGPGDTRLLYRVNARHGGIGDIFLHLRPVDGPKGQRMTRALAEQFGHWDQCRSASVFRVPACHLETLGMLVQVFPADPRLPDIAGAVDAIAMQPKLVDLLSVPDATQVVIDILQYKPGRKCLVRYALHGGSDGPSLVYGHVCPNAPATAHSLATIDAAWTNPVFDVPDYLGVSAHPAVVLTGHLPGQQLSMTVQASQFARHCEKIGLGLAAMHANAIEVTACPRRTIDIARVEEWSGALKAALPIGSDCIETALARVKSTLSQRASGRNVFVHGDFHVANILVDDDRIGLLDFEHAHIGDPAEDVGSFYAQLKLLALKTFQDRTALDEPIGRFMDNYQRHAQPEALATVAAHCALSCLWAAYFQCIQRPSKPEWFERACLMADLGCDIATRGLLR